MVLLPHLSACIVVQFSIRLVAEGAIFHGREDSQGLVLGRSSVALQHEHLYVVVALVRRFYCSHDFALKQWQSLGIIVYLFLDNWILWIIATSLEEESVVPFLRQIVLELLERGWIRTRNLYPIRHLFITK